MDPFTFFIEKIKAIARANYRFDESFNQVIRQFLEREPEVSMTPEAREIYERNVIAFLHFEKKLIKMQ